MIYLLDLNYTLAQSVAINFYNFTYDVSKDVYRKDLAEALKADVQRGDRIFLITARTDNYAEETKAKIQKEIGLPIERFYFKPTSKRCVEVHFFKKQVAMKLMTEGFKAEDFFGIESNAKTRKAYESIGIKSVPYAKFMEQRQTPTIPTLF